MKKKCALKSVLIGLFTAFAVAFLLGMGIPATARLAFLRDAASSTVFQRTLTFAERVAYQRAIEAVYWRHRIWPKENPRPKPPLDAIVSERQIEDKVEEYLRRSRLAAEQRGSAITGSELQTEMERVAVNTKQ